MTTLTHLLKNPRETCEVLKQHLYLLNNLG